MAYRWEQLGEVEPTREDWTSLPREMIAVGETFRFTFSAEAWEPRTYLQFGWVRSRFTTPEGDFVTAARRLYPKPDEFVAVLAIPFQLREQGFVVRNLEFRRAWPRRPMYKAWWRVQTEELVVEAEGEPGPEAIELVGSIHHDTGPVVLGHVRPGAHIMTVLVSVTVPFNLRPLVVGTNLNEAALVGPMGMDPTVTGNAVFSPDLTFPDGATIVATPPPGAGNGSAVIRVEGYYR